MTGFDHLPYLDLADPAFSTRGPEVRAARDASWCAATPYGLAVLRWREVGQILRDRRFRQGSHNWPDTNGLSGSFARFWKDSIIGVEGAAHRRMRDLVIPALHEDYVLSLRPAFEDIAERLCSDLRNRKTCEFQQDFAEPFAGQAITTLLGMDRSDWPHISHDTSELGLSMGVECKIHEPVIDAAYERLFDLSDELIGRVRSGQDSDSYVARLVVQSEKTGGSSELELRDLIVISILGGVDTTRSLLGHGLSLFIENPKQWQILRGRPDLALNAVDEIIRARPATTWVTREATMDIAFNDMAIPRGTVLHLLVHASACDPEICTNPAFDISARRKRHFGFGGGAHHCIGHLVARTDSAAALRALVGTFKTVAYDAPAEWLPDSGNTSAVRLPISYEVRT
ncbi:MAG: cytochrome P450 [Rhodobacteraceae bacterium]|nr:cytochrome P450 [Paracoccaceae bacterium]